MPSFFVLHSQKNRTFRAPHSMPPCGSTLHPSALLVWSHNTKQGDRLVGVSLFSCSLCCVVWPFCFALTRPLVHATIIAHMNVSLCLMFVCCSLIPSVAVCLCPSSVVCAVLCCRPCCLRLLLCRLRSLSYVLICPAAMPFSHCSVLLLFFSPVLCICIIVMSLL